MGVITSVRTEQNELLQHQNKNSENLSTTPLTMFTFLSLALFFLMCVSARPSSPGYVVSTTTTRAAISEMNDQNNSDHSSPYISLFHVTSHVQFRYAHTLVTSYVKNPTNTSQEISFAAVIPNDAFISNFSMVLQGEEHVAEVKEKEEARREYTEAVSRGSGAGLVSQDVRDANRFTVKANVGAGDKVEFRLTYDELLERKQGQYHLAINVNPGQIVDDLKIEVIINESLPISTISVPELKQSNEVDFEPDQESQVAVVERDIDGDESRASVVFEPSRKYQEEAGQQGQEGTGQRGPGYRRILCPLLHTGEPSCSSQTCHLCPGRQWLHGWGENQPTEGRNVHYSGRHDGERLLQHHHLQFWDGALESGRF